MTDSGDFNVLTVEQVEAVARAAADAQDAALYRVAAYTGLRQGELRALRWRHVPKHDAAERFSRFVDAQLGVSDQPGVRKSRRLSAQLIAA